MTVLHCQYPNLAGKRKETRIFKDLRFLVQVRAVVAFDVQRFNGLDLEGGVEIDAVEAGAKLLGFVSEGKKAGHRLPHLIPITPGRILENSNKSTKRSDKTAIGHVAGIANGVHRDLMRQSADQIGGEASDPRVPYVSGPHTR